MKVDDIMRRQPRVCSPDSSLATAGRIMAEAGCGVLPVLDAEDRVVGMITDRDVCVALAQRERKASEVKVREVTGDEAHACSAGDEIGVALARMRRHRVHRLPAIDGDGRLVGLLSIDDVILAWTGGERAEALDTDLAETLRTLCGHPVPALRG